MAGLPFSRLPSSALDGSSSGYNLYICNYAYVHPTKNLDHYNFTGALSNGSYGLKGYSSNTERARMFHSPWPRCMNRHMITVDAVRVQTPLLCRANLQITHLKLGSFTFAMSHNLTDLSEQSVPAQTVRHKISHSPHPSLILYPLAASDAPVPRN